MFLRRPYLLLVLVILLLPARSIAQNENAPGRSVPVAAFSTNILFDLATAVNLALEFPVAKQWTLKLEGIFPWWTWNDKANAFQINHLNLGTRYWLGGQPFRGWYGTAGIGAGRFDIQPKTKGWRGWEAMVSLGGGYSLPVTEHIFFDFGLGLGPIYTQYDKYEEVAPGLRAITDPGKRNLILGPTDLHVSLIFLFTRSAH